MDFLKKLKHSIEKNNSLLCIGLDTDIDKIPPHLISSKDPLYEFNKEIIDATYDLLSSYKINIAFYEALGVSGLSQMERTIIYIHNKHKDLPVILDAKRSDIGNTARMYAKASFEQWHADAVTVNPYLGTDSIEPFLDYKNKGIIIVCKSSNPNASDFQNLRIDGEPLYIKVTRKVLKWNTKYNNCLMVVGPINEIKAIRKILPDMFFLVPGIGAQGGDLEKTLHNGLRQDKSGLIIHSARAIIYASSDKNFAQKARDAAKALKNEINKKR